MAQGIQIGDAVLKMFVDWTEINNVATDLPSKLKPGTDAAASLGGKFEAVGKSASTAGAQATAAGSSIATAGNKASAGIKGADQSTQALIGKVKALESESAKLQLEIQQLQAKLAAMGQEGQNAGRRLGTGLRDARGEAALLGELTGVRLPRHVRTFLAELPGLSTALSAAFEATAVIFLIEAVVQLGEKIEAFIEKPQRIAEAWDRYRETVFESGQQIRGEIDKEEQKLIEMAQGPVAALDFALKHLQTTAAETFKLITSDIGDAVKAMQEQSGFGNVFGDAAKDLEHFQNALQKAMREAEQAHPDQPFVAYNAAIAAVQQKERDLTALIKQREAASGADSSAATSGLHAERQAINDLLPLLQKGIELDQLKIKAAKSDESVAVATQLAEVSKRAFDTRIAQINDEKAAQQLLYAESKIGIVEWARAQGDATRAAIDAQLKYKESLLAAARASGEATKIQAASQELALEKTKQQTDSIIRLATAFEFIKKVQAELKELTPQVLRVQGDLSDEITKGLDQATAAAQALGFTFTGDLYTGIIKAKEAYDKLQKSGHATYADLFWNPARAAADFTAAAEFFAISAVAGVAAHAINPGPSYSASGNNASPSSIGSNGQASAAPTSSQNVDHFGSGALVSRRMMGVIGDNPSGGDAPEAIIPLHDDRAKQGIADALIGNMVAALSGIAPGDAFSLPPDLVAEVANPQPFTRATLQVAREAGSLGSASGPQLVSETHHNYETLHVHVEMPITGVYHDGNLDKLAPKIARRISEAVSSGKVRLKASTSYRVTKRG